MEIQALRLLVTERDLFDLAVRGPFAPRGIKDLHLRVTPEGLLVTGVYPSSFLEVPFATLWQLGVRDGKLTATLTRLHTGPGPHNVALDFLGLLGSGSVRGLLMNAIARAAQHEDGVRVEGETVVVDADRLAAKQGLPLRSNFTAVHCGPGSLVLESGDRNGA
jgi:hypothetical protein